MPSGRVELLSLFVFSLKREASLPISTTVCQGRGKEKKCLFFSSLLLDIKGRLGMLKGRDDWGRRSSGLYIWYVISRKKIFQNSCKSLTPFRLRLDGEASGNGRFWLWFPKRAGRAILPILRMF
jgi:hypothetical protein